MTEKFVLIGPLKATNRPCALAKIAGIEMCWSYNGLNGTQYLAVMPTNSYDPVDNYHPENSYVIPALIRKFHQAKINNSDEVVVLGTVTLKREFLYNEDNDMADACVYLMNLPNAQYKSLLGSYEFATGKFEPPQVNIGYGEDITIKELAETAKQLVGFAGNIAFDTIKPDGTMRKLMDVSLLCKIGWKAKTTIDKGLSQAYDNFLLNSA